MTKEEKQQLMDEMDADYKSISINDIDPEARILASSWGEKFFPGESLALKVKLASDFMNYARRYSRIETEKVQYQLMQAIEELNHQIDILEHQSTKDNNELQDESCTDKGV